MDPTTGKYILLKQIFGRLEKVYLNEISPEVVTSQPVLEVVQPHAGQLVVAVSDHVSDGVEGVVQLNQQPLRSGVVEPIHCHQVHVVEGKVLELCIDEVILLGVTGHDIGQIETVVHHGGPVEAEAQ